MSTSTRWEYKTLRISPKIFGNYDPDEIDEQLGRLGAQGWELTSSVVAALSLLLFFKRPR